MMVTYRVNDDCNITIYLYFICEYLNEIMLPSCVCSVNFTSFSFMNEFFCKHIDFAEFNVPFLISHEIINWCENKDKCK